MKGACTSGLGRIVRRRGPFAECPFFIISSVNQGRIPRKGFRSCRPSGFSALSTPREPLAQWKREGEDRRDSDLSLPNTPAHTAPPLLGGQITD